MNLKAMIFDCDGVIVDSEPTHFRAFEATLADDQITLTFEDYQERYLAMDDLGCFRAVFADQNRALDMRLLKKLVLEKKARYAALSATTLRLYPDTVDFIHQARKRYRLAIASGAFRAEIKAALALGDLQSCFEVIVSAQDVKRGKPDPEAYLTALDRLNRSGQHLPLQPHECLVIEDSLHGVQSARAAGMACVAVTHSYTRAQLEGHANRVVASLSELSVDDLLT